MLKVREAMESEIGIIRELRLKAYEAYAQILPKTHWEALKKSIMSEADKQLGVELLVAELDEEIVGSVALFPMESEAYPGLADIIDYPEIRMLAVRAQSQRKGVAKDLIKECINRAQRKGSQFIGLHTADFMESAVRLYNSMGFERVPEFDFQPADDDIIVKAYRLSI